MQTNSGSQLVIRALCEALFIFESLDLRQHSLKMVLCFLFVLYLISNKNVALIIYLATVVCYIVYVYGSVKERVLHVLLEGWGFLGFILALFGLFLL